MKLLLIGKFPDWDFFKSISYVTNNIFRIRGFFQSKVIFIEKSWK